MSDAYSDGLRTTVHPAASAGATFCANSMSGAFHGMIAATTPTGSRNVMKKMSGPVCVGSVSPAMRSIHPAW